MLGMVARTHPIVAFQQGMYSLWVRFTQVILAPGTQADGEVVQPWSVAGTVKIDDSRQLVIAKQGVVGEQIGVTQSCG
ncbi:MAG: hypothetical protein HW380_22 [Magnetococcales bacterium]|nr:hypothetical protein [Magnetococcales bacterium]